MNHSRQDHAYAILKTLHRSGHYIVYLGKHYISQELVVIKTIDPKWKSDPKLHQQLRNEAALNLRLDNSQIRRMRGVFEDDANLYLVMDYIEGKALGDILGSGISLALEPVKSWLDGILDALEHAHGLGIIHQNLNPANVIITEASLPVILGFGKPDKAWMNVQEEKGKIHPLMFVAPEVFLGGKPQPASDIYSVGVLAYLMLCGRLPWTVDQGLQVNSQKQASLARPVLDPEFISRTIPHWLYTVIHKCLRLDPGRRFESAHQLRDALNAMSELPLEPIQIAGEEIVGKRQEPVIPLPKEPQISPNTQEPVRQEPEPAKDEPKPLKTEPWPLPKVPVEPSTVAVSKPAPFTPPPKRDPIPPVRREPVPPPKISRNDMTRQEPDSPPFDPKIRKWGSYMGIASLLVILFAVVKYTFFDNRPRLQTSKSKDTEEDDSLMPRVQNQAIDMVFVQGDSTVIGSVAPEADDDEFPPLKVRVPNFWISPYEITNLQWSMVYPEHFYNQQEKNMPVTNVSFLEVLEYCNEKSLMDKLTPCYDFLNGYVCDFEANGYRLPTEAEWEYAAKARKKDKFTLYSGSDDAERVGWYSQNSDGRLQPVGKKRPNELGLYDMSGNAYEWVWNWYGAYSSSSNAFEGPARGTDRVIRGGSYYHDANAMRVTNRSYSKQFAKSPYIGFRVVRSDK